MYNNSDSKTPVKQKFVAKGHDAYLKSAQDRKEDITLTDISGETHFGKMVNRDKFTITILCNDGKRETFYKHALLSFVIHGD